MKSSSKPTEVQKPIAGAKPRWRLSGKSVVQKQLDLAAAQQRFVARFDRVERAMAKLERAREVPERFLRMRFRAG